MLSNEELVKLIKEGQDPDGKYMMQLWKQNHGMIWKTINVYTKFEDPEDLMQEAFIGLKKAVELFDPDMETSFITYAVFWVKQVVSRYVKNNGKLIRIPVYKQDLMYRKKRFISEYCNKFGKDPSDKQIAAELDITVEQLKTLNQSESDYRYIKSISEPIDSKDGKLTLEDLLSDDGSTPQEEVEEQIYREQRAKAVWNEVDQLPDKQKTVILMRYLEELTLDECAKATGVTTELIRKRQIDAVRTLGSGKHRKILIQYADSNPYSSALQGSIANFRRTHTSTTEKLAIRNVENHRAALNRIAAFIQESKEENGA